MDIDFYLNIDFKCIMRILFIFAIIDATILPTTIVVVLGINQQYGSHASPLHNYAMHIPRQQTIILLPPPLPKSNPTTHFPMPNIQNLSAPIPPPPF